MMHAARNLILLVLMLCSAGLASLLRPTVSLADERSHTDLNNMVPTSLGNWREQASGGMVIVDPQRQQMIEKLYSDTLTRTYVNEEGYRIMLSIAYGKDQRDGMEMHKPDVCYPAQGFNIHKKEPLLLDVAGMNNPLPTLRMETSQGTRNEPLMYWTLAGTKLFNSRLEKKYIEMRYAIRNKIPDGMLVRISSIDSDISRAEAMQRSFANAMYSHLGPDAKARLFGTPDFNS